jgi:transposase
VGIDTHRDFIAVALLVRYLDSETEKVFKKHFPTTLPGLTAASGWVRGTLTSQGFHAPTKEDLHYTIESTACYHFPVLLAWGGKPAIVNPNLLKAGRRKTDDIDAGTLAEMDIDQRWPTSFLFNAEQMGLRILARQHRYASRLVTRYTRSLNSQLLKFGITVGREGSINGTDLRPCIEDLFQGKLPIPQHLRDCVPDRGLPTWICPVLERLYTWSDEAKKTQTQLWEELIGRLARTFYWCGGKMRTALECWKLLKSIPGVGDVVALWLLAEIGDVRRFPTPNSLAAWGGCDLSLRISAGQVTSFTRRKGHATIHWLLVQAAQAALRSNNPLGQWGKRRVHKGGKGATQRAVGAVARRIAVGAFWVLNLGEVWQPTTAVKECSSDETKSQADSGASSKVDERPTGSTGAAGTIDTTGNKRSRGSRVRTPPQEKAGRPG